MKGIGIFCLKMKAIGIFGLKMKGIGIRYIWNFQEQKKLGSTFLNETYIYIDDIGGHQ